jgi:hypothetical protein
MSDGQTPSLVPIKPEGSNPHATMFLHGRKRTEYCLDDGAGKMCVFAHALQLRHAFLLIAAFNAAMACRPAPSPAPFVTSARAVRAIAASEERTLTTSAVNLMASTAAYLRRYRMPVPRTNCQPW